VSSLIVARPADAQLTNGTWVRSDAKKTSPGLTMTIEPCCGSGRRITYRIEGRSEAFMTLDSPLDGTDAPVLIGGKPSGETMAIKRLDDRHTLTVLKWNGQVFGNSKATLSADGRTLMIENEITAPVRPGQTVGKETETWVRK
jgi:hypothetical protein